MAETIKTPKFEDFAYQGDEPTVTVEEILARRQELWVPTGYSSDNHEQHLLVTRTLPSAEITSDTTPIVRGTAFSDEASRPENGVFDYLVAEGTGRPVYSVHVPGVHFGPWRDERYDAAFGLTPDQKEDLKNGSFRKVGNATMIAVERVEQELNPQGEGNFIVSASSQGAAVMAGGIPAAVERGVKIDGMVFSEIVNNVERPPIHPHFKPPFLGGLAEEFVVANDHAEDYLNQNPRLLRDSTENRRRWLRRTANNLGANLAYAGALAKGKFNEDLDAETLKNLSRGDLDTQVVLTRGGESLLSREGAFEEVKLRMGAKGLSVVDITYPTHTHPYTMTVRSIIDPVNSLRDVA